MVAILEKARSEEAVLLTHDLGFGELLALAGAALPSVVIFRLRNMRPENVNHYLGEVLTRHLEALTEGAVISISDRRVRVRHLPIR
jgi:predicted nuclease of predicted toxin-antitoxin system